MTFQKSDTPCILLEVVLLNSDKSTFASPEDFVFAFYGITRSR